MSADSLRTTALHSRHASLGGRLVPFAGWEMPVQYQGVMEEHRAVRTACGVFDVSHMGQVSVSGPQALELLQRLTSNDVSKIPVGGAQYGLLCTEDGGVLDDLFTYRLGEDSYLTVTNASNHATDFEQFLSVGEGFPGATVFDCADDYAMIAVQGPSARGIVAAAADEELPGEDGVEILCDPSDAVTVWDALIEAGAVPCGLGSRDTLRIEAGYHLYGNDLSVDRNPIEAGLGWACREETGFIGCEVVAEARESGTSERLVGFQLTGPGVARSECSIVGGGTVSSGTFSPTFEVGLGMAYVPAALAVAGTAIEIDVRGKLRSAEVRDRPIYRKAD
ncbi:MAG: glycine cleavage system protein T [Solirubrobacterales bacterium]|nr:glycine cleavage system protein T [Solirubrobacterales bacterium]